MKSIRVLMGIVVLGIATSFAATSFGQETEEPVESRIRSLSVFKNGLVLVQEEISVPGEGRFLLKSPPSSIHGTFFVESDAIVSTEATERKISVPISEIDRWDSPADFEGLAVQMKLSNGESLDGKIVRVQNSRTARSSWDDPFSSSIRVPVPAADSSPFLFETNEGSQVWISSWNQIEKLSFAPNQTIRRDAPVLIFNVERTTQPAEATETLATKTSGSTTSNSTQDSQPIVIRLSYLTKGLSWAPSYRIDLTDPKTLSIEQNAALINEWNDFENVPVSLVSGFPRVQFENVFSPTSPDFDLNSFFASLANRNSGLSSLAQSNSVATQQIVMNNAGPPQISDYQSAATDSSVSGGEQPDNYYQNVGSKTLKKSDRVQFEIARKTVPYQRIVRWDIDDVRDENGRPTNRDENFNYGRTTSGDVPQSSFQEPWDVLRFNNPFDFPLTTGPVSIFGDEKFFGQNMSFWYNPDEEMNIPINKALSVRGKSSESEQSEYDRPRQNLQSNKPIPSFNGSASLDYRQFLETNVGGTVQLWNAAYRVAVINAEISLENLRNVETDVCLRRRFSGELFKDSFKDAEIQPKIKMSTDFSRYNSGVNRVGELSWNLKLQPGEKKTIAFSYILLVR